MTHRAPKTNGHTHARGHMRHVLVGKAVGQIKQTFSSCFVRRVNGPRQRRQHPRHPTRRYSIACRLDAQTFHLTLGIDGGGQLRHMHGAIKIVRHVFFTRPHQLNWRTLECHGNLGGLRHHIGF